MADNEEAPLLLASVRTLVATMASSGAARDAAEGFDEARSRAVGIIDAALAAAGGGRMLTIRQVMSITGVSRRTIYNWMESGRVETARTPGGMVRISESSLWRVRR